MLELWISKVMADKLILTGEVIHQKWKQFADIAGIPDDECLNLSKGWMTSFKTWNGLKNMKWHGEGASTSADTVEKETQRVQELIWKEGYKLWNIFNANETSFFYVWAINKYINQVQQNLILKP